MTCKAEFGKKKIKFDKKTANQMKRCSTGAASQQKRICVTEIFPKTAGYLPQFEIVENKIKNQ
jgi:hypothetical protein